MLDVPFKWELESKIKEATRGLAESHEVESVRRDVGRLERAIGEVRAEVDGLRNELAFAKDQIADLLRIAETTSDAIRLVDECRQAVSADEGRP